MVYLKIVFTFLLFFHKMIKGGWNRNGWLENFSRINEQGDDYSVLESTLIQVVSGRFCIQFFFYSKSPHIGTYQNKNLDAVSPK